MLASTSINLDAFRIEKVLGKGGFGKVLLVKKRTRRNFMLWRYLKRKCLRDKNSDSILRTKEKYWNKQGITHLSCHWYFFSNCWQVVLCNGFYARRRIILSSSQDRQVWWRTRTIFYSWDRACIGFHSQIRYNI